MKIGAYTPGDPLGEHDDVFQGTDGDGNPVLIARFELGEEGIDALRQDAAACRALGHPAVVAPLDVVDIEGGLALIFEDVQGTTLANVLAHLEETNELLSDGAALKIGGVIADALHAAHTAKGDDGRMAPLVHAQLGPHQIYLMYDGDVRLLGLGLGTAFRTAAARHEPPEDAKPFVAPECAKGGALTVRANVYSLGVLLWRLLSRKPLPKSGGLPPLRDLRPNISTQLTSLVDRAVESSMLKRTVSAFQIAQAIERSGLADDRDLRWNLELFSELEGFGDDAPVQHSFPPGKLSDVPPSSVQPISDPLDSQPTRVRPPPVIPMRDALDSLDWSLDEPVKKEAPAEKAPVRAEPEERPRRVARKPKPRAVTTTAPSLVALTKTTTAPSMGAVATESEAESEPQPPVEPESPESPEAPGVGEGTPEAARNYLDVPPMPALTPEMEATRKRIERASRYDLVVPEEVRRLVAADESDEGPRSEEPATQVHTRSALLAAASAAREAGREARRDAVRPRRAASRAEEGLRPVRRAQAPANALVLTPTHVLVGGLIVAALCGGFFAAGYFVASAQGVSEDAPTPPP